MNREDLKTNSVDIATSIISASVSIVPYAGGFLSELVQGIIPNQRQDRIVKFISELCERLDEMEFSIEELKNRYQNQKYGMFTYDCLRNVVDDVYDEKLDYYKNLCLNAITENEKNLIHCERILKILSGLDYFEILYLEFYSDCMATGTKTMNDVTAKLGFDVLRPAYTLSMNDAERDEETYKQITLNNLCNAGLLNMEVRPVGSGRTKRTSYEITPLGRLVLRKIKGNEKNISE